MLTRDALEKAAELYLSDYDRRDPKASALYGDFNAVPPVLFHVGEDEILLDDSHRVGERIDATGGLVQIHIWEGTTHVFPSNFALQAAKEALDSTGKFLRHHFDNEEMPRSS
jgi:epsilon-lactone hydrolase